MAKPSVPGSMQSRTMTESSRGRGWGGEEVGEGGVAVGFVVGAVALGLEIEEETLGEVFFVFDEGDEGDVWVQQSSDAIASYSGWMTPGKGEGRGRSRRSGRRCRGE